MRFHRSYFFADYKTPSPLLPLFLQNLSKIDIIKTIINIIIYSLFIKKCHICKINFIIGRNMKKQIIIATFIFCSSALAMDITYNRPIKNNIRLISDTNDGNIEIVLTTTQQHQNPSLSPHNDEKIEKTVYIKLVMRATRALGHQANTAPRQTKRLKAKL